VFIECKVFKLFYLNVYFIFLNVSHELERMGTFDPFGDYLISYFAVFYLEDENNRDSENPLFYFVNSYFF